MAIAHLDLFPASPEGAEILSGSPLLAWIARMEARPSVKATGWQGVMVRAGTPKDIVARINAQVSSIMAMPDMKSRIVEQGFIPVTMGIGETEKFVSADVERWGKIIRDGNIKAE